MHLQEARLNSESVVVTRLPVKADLVAPGIGEREWESWCRRPDPDGPAKVAFSVVEIAGEPVVGRTAVNADVFCRVIEGERRNPCAA